MPSTGEPLTEEKTRPRSFRHTTLHGHKFFIESNHGRVPAVEYCPAEGATLVATVLLTPGSGGGLGPGVAIHPQPFDDIRLPKAHGAIYTRLGIELSSGTEVSWQYRPIGTNILEMCDGSKMGATKNVFAVLQIDWTNIPRTKLRRIDMLESSVADTLAAAHWLLDKYPTVPLLLGGFSFGGPTNWAVASKLVKELGPPDQASNRAAKLGGIFAIAGSARGGERFEELGLGTASAVREVSSEGVPVFFLHGTHDKNVALQVAEFLYKEASVPKEMVVIPNSPHMFDNCRDTAYRALIRWLLSVGLGSSDPNSTKLKKPSIAKKTVMGKPIQKISGESKGKERWRCAISNARLNKYCSENLEGELHPLAGLVGYSE